MADNFPKDTSHFKLLISDFDGTLVGADHTLSPKIKKAITKWEESGRHFAIATGRQFLMLKQDCGDNFLKTPIIVRGGAEIYDPQTQKSIYSQFIEEKVIRKFVKLVSAKGYDVIIEKDDIFYADVPYYRMDYTFLKNVPLASFSGSAPKINVRVGDHDPLKVEKFMSEKIIPNFPTLNITKSYSPLGKSWDITSEKATKHLAVLELMKILRIKPEDTVGVGDGYNDYPLLTACGFKVAMGNANEELKKLADVIVSSYEEDGVAFLINKLLENHKSEITSSK